VGLRLCSCRNLAYHIRSFATEKDSTISILLRFDVPVTGKVRLAMSQKAEAAAIGQTRLAERSTIFGVLQQKNRTAESAARSAVSLSTSVRFIYILTTTFAVDCPGLHRRVSGRRQSVRKISRIR